MSIIPVDCVKVICLYLPFDSICEVRATCRSWRQCLADDPTFFSSILAQFWPPDLLAKQRISISSQDAWKVLIELVRAFENKEYLNLQRQVLYASSIDRWQESAHNMVDPNDTDETCVSRRCYATGNQISVSDRQLILAQYRCGCAGPRSCYWSSSPSPNGDNDEFVVIKCHSAVSLILGFVVRPYQAAWHPSAPTYGPREVCVEFLAPEATERTYPALPSFSRRNDNFRCDPQYLDSEQVYYRSPFFPVKNHRKAQVFTLPTPQLLIGGRVRLIFRGMYQRQTMGGDDYYLCLNPGKIYGIPLPVTVTLADDNSPASPPGTVFNRPSFVSNSSATTTPGATSAPSVSWRIRYEELLNEEVAQVPTNSLAYGFEPPPLLQPVDIRCNASFSFDI